jgi:putative transposase
MTSAPDCLEIVALITEAVDTGAREGLAYSELGLHPRTYQRWRGADGEVMQDLRPLAERPSPANRLTEDERDQIVATCNAAEFASLPPSQIVPRLADRGTYIASESSFYRVLRQRGQNHSRGRARATTRSKPPATFEAKGPRQFWSWDITWLPGPVLGLLY